MIVIMQKSKKSHIGRLIQGKDSGQKRVRDNQRVEISDEMRKALGEWRRSKGLSYHDMALYLEVNWSTYRKWELGVTRRYSRRCQKLVQSLLEKDCIEPPALEQEDEDETEQLMKRMRAVGRMCAKNNALNERFRRKLGALLDDMIELISITE